MFARLQEIASCHGLRNFGDGPDGRERYFTKVEGGLARQGRYMWKGDLCNRTVVARRLSRDEPAFLEALGRLGVSTVERGDGGYLFSLKGSPQRWRATGRWLGGTTRGSSSWTRFPCPAPLEAQACHEAQRHGVVCVGETVRGAAAVADAAHGEAIADVALALKVQDDFGIKCLAEYDDAIRALSADPSRAREVEVLCRAREVATRGDFFLGVSEASLRGGGTRNPRSRPTGSPRPEEARQVRPVRGRAEEPRPGRSRRWRTAWREVDGLAGRGIPSSSRLWSTRPLADWIDTAMLEGKSGLVRINLTMRIRVLTCGFFLRMV